jgi:hypothetical protein
MSDEEAFFSEWHETRDGLKALLDEFGEHDPFGDHDYYVGDSADLSRGIGVFVTSDALQRLEVMDAVQQYLRNLRQQYEIVFTIETPSDVSYLFIQGEERIGCLSDDIRDRLKL